MIAKVDEDEVAMIAFAMHPARYTDGFADMGGAEFGANMSAIGVHGFRSSRAFAEMTNACQRSMAFIVV
jgi:hypothetical protein